MMRKLLAWPFEFVHLVGAAVFFTLGVLMSLINAAAVGHPAWMVKISKLSLTDAAERYGAVSTAIGAKAMWLAGAALIGALVAPFARGDGKKAAAWVRVACAAVTLVIASMVWGGVGSEWIGKDAIRAKSDAMITPWHCLAVACGLDLVLIAFAVTGGAAAKKPAGDGGAKK